MKGKKKYHYKKYYNLITRDCINDFIDPKLRETEKGYYKDQNCMNQVNMEWRMKDMLYSMNAFKF